MKICIRTDGNNRLGNGHVVRMLAMADEFLSRKIPVMMAMKDSDFWKDRIAAKGISYQALNSGADSVEELCSLIKREGITHLVYDTRHDLTQAQLSEIKVKAKVKIVVIDSPEDTRLSADVAIFPPIPQLKEWSWTGFKGKIYSGWEYVLLRPEFKHRSGSPEKKILLSFGSTDPNGLTEKVLKEIRAHQELFSGYEFLLLAGPQFERLKSISDSEDFKKLPISILQSPPEIAKVFSSVSYALIAFGLTAYELAALSVPFLYISLTPDHEKSASVFEKAGLGVSLGLADDFTRDFAAKVKQLIQKQSATGIKLEIGDWSKIIDAALNG